MAAPSDRDKSADPVSGRAETKGAAPNNANTGDAHGAGTVNKVDPQSSSSAIPMKHPTNTAPIFTTTSASNSPRPSRESSPTRPPLKPGTSSSSRGPRSRKDSQDVSSPNRAQSVSGANVPSVPSAAAIQRALSIANTPQSHSAAITDPIKSPRPLNTGGGTPNNIASNWATSPRLKSPPPASHPVRPSTLLPRNSEPALQTPSIFIQRSSPTTSSPSTNEATPKIIDTASEPQGLASGMRTPGRGPSGTGSTLETVQESSLPATPAIGPGGPQLAGKLSEEDRPETIAENPMEETVMKRARSLHESGSESGGNKSEGKARQKPAVTNNASRPNTLPPRKSYTTLRAARGKVTGEGSTKNMTVETETVSSIPQVAVGGGAGERGVSGRSDVGGSLRLKPSTETIRPKKEKKKTTRKPPSINAGTGGSIYAGSRRFHHHHLLSRPSSPSLTSSDFLNSAPSYPGYKSDRGAFTSTISSDNLQPSRRSSSSSAATLHHPRPRLYSLKTTLTDCGTRLVSSKADVFEAKVANAVDEANSSDSEETFVYESNPPDPHPPRPGRYHSRTPSATSMQSQREQRGGMRSVQNLMDGSHSIAGKRSMKFANNSYHSGVLEDDAHGRGDSIGRGVHSDINNDLHHHHHHIGQFGRGARGHTSLFDNESPFAHAPKPLRSTAGNTSRLSSRPGSPRSPHHLRINGINGKKAGEASNYDIEADDERTPLVGSIRSSRARAGAGRRPNSSSIRQMEFSHHRERSFLARFTACIVLTTMLILVLLGVVAFFFATTKPLYKVDVREIQNVLASEQEIMLDLLVEAVNPNVMAITIGDMDVNVFAKSKHVGTDRLWRDRKRRRSVLATSPSITAAGDPDDYHTTENVDEGTDPITDPESDRQTMLLGRIIEFDSILTFDGSPFRHHLSSSVGEVRLAKPGNKTEQGGTERWERVIQYPFELIVRGVLKYQLPLSSRMRTAKIGASIVVYPEEAVDGSVPAETKTLD
ncbi:MAG: hypothetical protein M1827_004600 [Pycnora praestabilis]|nr:MAG: hypothetical protein M1827_004600 [Pycnora praestabilis]